MVLLPKVTEEGITDNIKKRYMLDKIYVRKAFQIQDPLSISRWSLFPSFARQQRCFLVVRMVVYHLLALLSRRNELAWRERGFGKIGVACVGVCAPPAEMDFVEVVWQDLR